MRALAAVLLLIAATAARAEPVATCFVVDPTFTNRAHLDEALAAVSAYAEKAVARPVARWEDAEDLERIVVAVADASPEVVFAGDARAWQSVDRGGLAGRIRARREYARCTDLDRAFSLAARSVAGARVRRIVAFTDLVHEPPDRSVSRCRAAASVSSTFPWSALEGVDVDVYWAPAAQVLAWRREAEARGAATFRVHTEQDAPNVAPADQVTSAAPTAAERKDAAQRAERLGGAITSLAKTALAAAVALIVVLGAAAVAVRVRRSRQGLAG